VSRKRPGSVLSLSALFILASGTALAQDFTIIGLPDTQYYAARKHGGRPETFEAQTRWIVEQRDSLNIVFVAHFGDCVEHGDSKEREWERAERAMGLLEDPETTGLLDGIPYGIAPGNHDQSPEGEADGLTTRLYNRYFGEARFSGRDYYGGHFGDNNDNHFELFSARDLDFIAIHMEFDESPDAPVLTWADSLLTAHADRRAIVVSHYLIAEDGSYGIQGRAIHGRLKENPNLFLMLCGHVYGEGRREDVFAGNRIHTLVANYQYRDHGGDGWLRIIEFSPASNQIRVKTYSPTLDRFETDPDSQFTLSYEMQGAAAETP
jgi:hypothetical protein